MTDGPALGAESAADSPEAPPATQHTRRKPIRYNAATATPRLQRAAADPGPEAAHLDHLDNTEAPPPGDDAGTDTDDGPHPNQSSGTETQDTGGEFTDAFRPTQETDDDGGFTPEEYAALAAETIQEADEDTEPAQSVREARYRVRLRAAEKVISRQNEVIETFQRNEIQRLAAGRLADPADLFVDHTVSDCLDASDAVDPAKVDAVVDRLIASHPHWQRPRERYAGPLHSGASERPTPGGSWRDAFAPRAE
ncbi:hypothetical protein [Mycobacterium sp. URHD0025]|uniref:hypothetical protein n=1 Tax=Mycobacterium sp. URHD0025 TaxID=1298864 RepID=UPI000414A416|nr:hypothetical protein [Mycobacterium sp. URHD0025]